MDPRPLSHVAFLTRADATDDFLRIHAGQAAFLVLRLVDLLTPERRDALDPRLFEHQWTACDQFVRELESDDDGEIEHLRGLLDSSHELFEQRTEHTLSRCESALSSYALSRRDREYYDEAIDLLQTAVDLLRGSAGEAPALVELGECLVRAGRLDDAATLYETIGHSALRDGPLLGRLGEADVLLARGKVKAAERLYRRVRREAREVKYDWVALRAEEGAARAVLAQGRTRDGVLAAWRLAHRDQNHGEELLASALEALGALDAAARLYVGMACGGGPLDRRWQALAALVRIATRQNNRLAFERWRKLGERYRADGMPSAGAELDLWLEIARGAVWFAAEELERQALGVARGLARRSVRPDAAVRLRAVETDGRERRAPAPPPLFTIDAELEPIFTAIGRRAEPSEWLSPSGLA